VVAYATRISPPLLSFFLLFLFKIIIIIKNNKNKNKHKRQKNKKRESEPPATQSMLFPLFMILFQIFFTVLSNSLNNRILMISNPLEPCIKPNPQQKEQKRSDLIFTNE
jgi:hypothetical protein